MALPLIPSNDVRDRFHREGVTDDIKRPNIPPLLGLSMTSSSSEGAERFLPVVGSESAAAADVVAGVRGGRGGRCCSGDEVQKLLQE